ncbi:MAG TPA: hypothetical protein VD971_04825 [Phycisphaerales bacterium]|nr:hypothetical protein [Phycisphaerales bacterium]
MSRLLGILAVMLALVWAPVVAAPAFADPGARGCCEESCPCCPAPAECPCRPRPTNTNPASVVPAAAVQTRAVAPLRREQTKIRGTEAGRILARASLVRETMLPTGCAPSRPALPRAQRCIWQT